ncbi:MAG: tryptophan--tRNA ligase, partial [Gammaproteobacteria bacterium]
VPVGEDQVAHVELTREVARRFNYLYGRTPDFAEQAAAAITKLGSKNAAAYQALRKRYQEQGDQAALEQARALLAPLQNISPVDRERLCGYLEGGGRVILPEPQALLTPTSKMPGLDGQKMSKSYGNTIGLREDPKSVETRLRTMRTDPARVRRTDPGEPTMCPVWPLHQVYSNDDTKAWVQQGCRSAGIGCLECKQPVIDAVLAELAPIRARAAEFSADPNRVKKIIADGCAAARDVARETLDEVRQAVGVLYS